MESNIDILFVTHRHKIAGGAEKALLDLIQFLKSNDINMHVIVGSEGDFTGELRKLDIPYNIIFQPYWAHSDKDPSPFQFTSLNPTVNTTLQTVELIRKLKPKLCVTNTIVVPWLAYACSLTGTTHAWMIHELGTAGLNLRYSIGEKQTLRSIEQLSDHIFFNSEYTKKYYVPHMRKGLSSSIVYPIGSIPKPKSYVSPFRSTSSIKFVSVAQIKSQKGQMDAVRLMSELKSEGLNVELALVGLKEEKEYVRKLQKFIHDNKLNNVVHILGHKKNPASILNFADIALITSTNDAFGRVTVEAMFMEKPIIAADSAGTKEIIRDKYNGLLYEPMNINSMSEKAKMLISDATMAELLSRQAKKDAYNMYVKEKAYKPFLDYFKSLPTTKSALDLSPLGSIFIDFRSTIDLLEHTRGNLDNIESSRVWKYYSAAKRRLP